MVIEIIWQKISLEEKHRLSMSGWKKDNQRWNNQMTIITRDQRTVMMYLREISETDKDSKDSKKKKINYPENQIKNKFLRSILKNET